MLMVLREALCGEGSRFSGDIIGLPGLGIDMGIESSTLIRLVGCCIASFEGRA